MLTNLAGAWLRYTAALYSSYMCAVISSCCIGAAASVVICSFAYVPEQYFGTEERTLATALAVQSNYFGWALGCVLVPAIIHGADYVSDFQTFSLVQAVILTSSLLFFPVFKKTSKHEQEPSPSPDPRPTLLSSRLTRLLMLMVTLRLSLCLTLNLSLSFPVGGCQWRGEPPGSERSV